MPKVRFNTNLGSIDAKALGLKFEECTKEEIVDVTAEQLEGLKKIGPCVAFEVTDKEVREAKEAKERTARTEPKEGEFNKLDKTDPKAK